MKKPISIVLIEDNRMLREGLATLIREQPGFQVLAASANIIEALQKVRDAKPRVVLVDFGLQNHDSLRLTATLHREVPEAKVIVMGLLAQHEDIADFVRAGASGFVMKDAAIDEFFDTIRSVANGKEVLPTQLTGSLFKQIADRAIKGGKSPVLEAVRLTQRERQVVELIGEGLSNKEIAARLHVAIHTVKSHVHNVLEKLALHTRLEVAAFTRREGSKS
ncbi:MAG TPA: response regulator transcription factor [Gemmatimonadaceae bacterium]|nr:response regulator transcription factor [Gemmatimonadaceae bacterium]